MTVILGSGEAFAETPSDDDADDDADDDDSDNSSQSSGDYSSDDSRSQNPNNNSQGEGGSANPNQGSNDDHQWEDGVSSDDEMDRQNRIDEMTMPATEMSNWELRREEQFTREMANAHDSIHDGRADLRQKWIDRHAECKAERERRNLEEVSSSESFGD